MLFRSGGFAGFALAGAFAQGYVGYGWDDMDLERQGVVENMTANTDGSHWTAGAKAGYLMPLGSMRFGICLEKKVRIGPLKHQSGSVHPIPDGSGRYDEP